MRRESDLMLAALPARFDRLEGDVRSITGRVSRFETGLAENNAATDRVEKNTKHIVAFVDDVSAVWRVCKIVRRATFRGAKWLAVVAGAFTAVIAALQAAGSIDVTEWWK